MADPIKTPQQMAEQVWQAMQAQNIPSAPVAPTTPPVEQVNTAPVSVTPQDNGVLNLWNGKVVLKSSPKYKALIESGYTDEKIMQELSKKQQKTTPSGQTIQPAQETPQTIQVVQGEKPKTEQMQPVQQQQEQQLPDFQDDSQPRQQEIVNNLNNYYKSNPSMFQDRNLFNQSFSYDSRSDLQKSILDNWYKTNIDKVNEVATISRQLPWDIAKSYTSGNISEQDLSILKNTDPAKYAQVQDQIEKKKLMDKYSALLYGEEEQQADDPIKNIINKMETIITSTNDATMYEDYQKAMNSSDMQLLQNNLSTAEWEIKQIDEQINATKSELEAQFKWSGISQGRINAIIQDQVQLLQNKRNAKAIDYQTIADKYNNKLNTIKTNLEAQEKQYNMKMQQEQQTMQKLNFSYQIYSDVQKRQDAKKASDLEYLRDIEKMNMQQEMAFNQAVRMDKLENWDINNADPYIVKKAIEKNVDQLMQQYDGLITSTRDQLVTRIQDWLKTGKTYWQVQNEIMQDVKNKPEYQLWKNNKLGIDNKPTQFADWLYFQNGQVYTEATLRSKYWLSSKEVEAVQNQLKAQRASGWLDQYDNYDFVNKILNGEITNRNWVPCLPWQKWWQCAAFVNDMMWKQWMFWSTIESKINVTKDASWNSPVPIVWGAVVIDNGSTYTDTDGKKVNAGHVGIVTRVNPDWTFEYIDSNGKWWYEKIAMNNTSIKSNMYFTRAKDRQSPWTSQIAKPLSDDQRVVFNSQVWRFTSNPVVKQFEDAMTQYSNIKSSLENPSWPGDISAIFTFMKSLDPSSVVRESEFNTAASSAWVGDKIGNALTKLQNGQQLTNDQRNAFTALAKKFVENRALSYDRLYDDMVRPLVNNGIDKSYYPSRASDLIRSPQQQTQTNPFSFMWQGSTLWQNYLNTLSIFN